MSRHYCDFARNAAAFRPLLEVTPKLRSALGTLTNAHTGYTCDSHGQEEKGNKSAREVVEDLLLVRH